MFKSNLFDSFDHKLYDAFLLFMELIFNWHNNWIQIFVFVFNFKAGETRKIVDKAHEERSRAREARRETRKTLREKKYKIQIHLSKSKSVKGPIADGLSSDDDEDKADIESFYEQRSEKIFLSHFFSCVPLF